MIDTSPPRREHGAGTARSKRRRICSSIGEYTTTQGSWRRSEAVARGTAQVSRTWTGMELKGDVEGAGNDFGRRFTTSRASPTKGRSTNPRTAEALAGRQPLTMLSDYEWKLKYTPEDGNLVRKFYLPALEDAVRYDRLTGYFRASALALAARGIEGLVRNRGHMRLLVGWTLDKPEIEAIEAGESLREQLEKRLSTDALAPPDAKSEGALELLSWMVAEGYLEVKVAIPCDENRKPVAR